MGFLSNLLSGGAASLVDSVAKAADRFIETPKDRQAFKLEIEKMVKERNSEIEETIRAQLQTKQAILTAELQQGDNYTKRARPTVVYAGLVFIAINYVLIPMVGKVASLFGAANVCVSPLVDLPVSFWAAWGGICATWSIGRSVEKCGVRHPVVGAITGTKQPATLLD